MPSIPTIRLVPVPLVVVSIACGDGQQPFTATVRYEPVARAGGQGESSDLFVAGAPTPRLVDSSVVAYSDGRVAAWRLDGSLLYDEWVARASKGGVIAFQYGLAADQVVSVYLLESPPERVEVGILFEADSRDPKLVPLDTIPYAPGPGVAFSSNARLPQGMPLA